MQDSRPMLEVIVVLEPDQKEKTTTVTKYTVIEIAKKFFSLESYI